MLIGLAVLPPFACAAAHGQGDYLITTNNVGAIGIYWRSERLAQGRFEDVRISPDAAAIAWVEPYLTEHPGIENEGGEEATSGGNLWIAHEGSEPVLVQRPEVSRGLQIYYSPKSGIHTWHPNNLKWDSTSSILYFEASGCLTSGYLWRVRPGDENPRLVTMMVDYALKQEAEGLDSLLAYQRHIPKENNRISYCWFAYSSDSLDGEYQRSSELVDRPPRTR